MEETIRKVSAIFDKLASVKITPSSNYSVPEYWMSRAIKGDEKCKDNLFNRISISLNIDKSILNAVFNAKYKKTNESKNMKRTIRLTESDLHRIIKESVNRILKESNQNEIFTISAFNIENDEDVSDMQYCGQTYYSLDDAIASATEFAQSLIDYGSVVMVTVYAGEYQTESGDIFGEPQDVYTISNSDRQTTAIARRNAGYVTDKVNDYAI